jgi:site-specific DNA recombinase
MRAVGYIRVSDLSQVDGHSLDAQERLFRNLCENRGWELVRIYREEGKSAHVDAISKRPQFHKLLNDSAKGEFDVVVVHSLDRWSRNLRITLEAISILLKNRVGLTSITENIDYSKPEGMLFTQILGAFAEYYSGSLAKHVGKGLDQRAHEGKHTGGIPFGYESCWSTGNKAEKKLLCNPIHPAGIHIHKTEGQMVTELFNKYATGTTTLSRLASWLNEQGFRTRNMHPMPDANGNLISGPRLFTTASVRGILHNPFYTGKVIHRQQLMPGIHDPLISEELFEVVQNNLKKNSGRSKTLQAHPERFYMLKGIVRCAYCGMPMWAQTYQNGQRYYREHIKSRSIADCPAGGGSIPCHVIDEQVKKLVSAIELGPRWLEEVLAIVNLKDDVDRIKRERKQLQEKLRRLGQTYIDNLIDQDEYNRRRQQYQTQIESLIVPEASAAEEAGKLIQDLPKLWSEANQEEQRKLLLTMLDAVYIDTKKTKSIIALRPKAPFRPIFEVATRKQNSVIQIWKGNENESQRPSLFLVEAGESRTPRPEEATRNLLQAYSAI